MAPRSATSIGCMWRTTAATAALALALGAGCGSIRVVHEANSGGTVALQGPHDSARSKAEEYMRSQCEQGWEIVEEGEALASDGVSREWRITYACVGARTKTRVVAF